jgi:hypothetical protein
MLGDLGDRINRDPGNLVLEFQGGKIFYDTMTPLQLGISADAEVDMRCYERAVWDKLHPREATRAAPEDDDVQVDLSGGDKGKGKAVVDTVDVAPPPREATPPPVAKIIIKLRGKLGEAKFGVQPHITASQILQTYASRMGKREELGRLRLILDGEAVEEGATVADMDVESGTLLDVELR